MAMSQNDAQAQGQPVTPPPTMDEIVQAGLNEVQQGVTADTQRTAQQIKIDPEAYLSPMVNSARLVQAVTNADDAMKVLPVVANQAIQATLRTAETQGQLFSSSDAILQALSTASQALNQVEAKRDLHISNTVQAALPKMQETISRSAQAATTALMKATEAQERLSEADAGVRDPSRGTLDRLGSFFRKEIEQKNVVTYNKQSAEFAQTVQQNQQLLSNAQNMLIAREKLKVDPAEQALASDIAFFKTQLAINKDKGEFLQAFGRPISELMEQMSKTLFLHGKREEDVQRSSLLRMQISNATQANELQEKQIEDMMQEDELWTNMQGVLKANSVPEAKMIYNSSPAESRRLMEEVMRQSVTRPRDQVDLSPYLMGVPTEQRVQVLLDANRNMPGVIPDQLIQDYQLKENLTGQMQVKPTKEMEKQIASLRVEANTIGGEDRKLANAIFREKLGTLAANQITNSTEATSSLTSNYGFKNAKTITADTLKGLGMNTLQIEAVQQVASVKDSPKGFVDDLVIKLGNKPETHALIATYFKALSDKNNALGKPTVVGIPAQTTFMVEHEVPFRAWFSGSESSTTQPFDLMTPIGVKSYLQAKEFKLRPASDFAPSSSSIPRPSSAGAGGFSSPSGPQTLNPGVQR